MASSENSNLVTEFEQAYAEALAALCEEDNLCDKSAAEDQKIVRFSLKICTNFIIFKFSSTPGSCAPHPVLAAVDGPPQGLVKVLHCTMQRWMGHPRDL